MDSTEDRDGAGRARVRELRLRDMLGAQKGGAARRLVHAVFSVALRLFFRRIELSGAEGVPAESPVIFVLNHPNGLIDAALVFCALPRRVSFLAKSTLFRVPVLRTLLRVVEALPLYRRIDPGENVALNRRTFDACRALLARGRCIALFPEGLSHNEPRLLPLKTGAARIALASAAGLAAPTTSQPPLCVLPVGLYYTAKTAFRSEVLLRVGAPLPVPRVELNADGEPTRAAVQQLTAELDAALRAVTLNTADEGELREVERAEQLFASVYETLDERLPLAVSFYWLRRFAERLRRTEAAAPDRLADLRRRIAHYETELAALGVTPETLAVSALPPARFVRDVVLKGLLLLLLTPVAAVGALVHLPAYLLATLCARLYRTHGPDAAVATVKIFSAIVLMPLTWLLVSGACGVLWGWRVGLVVLPALVGIGYVALRVFEELAELRGWFRAGFVLLRRRALFLRLLLRRRDLQRAIREFVEEGQS
ncbi:MAG TPA: 1-acyl-sn-glycerol-3-phosphate acyltransferase [Pyrinomonadaceae bacterium]|jgi:1-acyl-sn-glycerol-3-phosphate acyltransferase